MRRSPIALVLGVLLAGCQNNEQIPTDPTNACNCSETIVPQIYQGEKARIERRDKNGHLYELEIRYMNDFVAVKHIDERSKTSKISLVMPYFGLKVEAQPTATGSSINWYEAKNNDNVPVYGFRRLSCGKRRYSHLREDRTLRFTIDQIDGSPDVFRTYHDNGTVELETSITVLRNWLKLYEPDGKLLYDEKPKEENQDPNDFVFYQGTVFNSEGQAALRITAKEGPYNGWQAFVPNVDALNADGTVRTSYAPEYGGVPGEVQPTDPLLRRIAEVKRTAHDLRQDRFLMMLVIERSLEEVIKQ